MLCTCKWKLFKNLFLFNPLRLFFNLNILQSFPDLFLGLAYKTPNTLVSSQCQINSLTHFLLPAVLPVILSSEGCRFGLLFFCWRTFLLQVMLWLYIIDLGFKGALCVLYGTVFLFSPALLFLTCYFVTGSILTVKSWRFACSFYFSQDLTYLVHFN